MKLTVPALPGLKVLVPLTVSVAPPVTLIVSVFGPPPVRLYAPVPDSVSGPVLVSVTGVPVVADVTTPELAMLKEVRVTPTPETVDELPIVNPSEATPTEAAEAVTLPLTMKLAPSPVILTAVPLPEAVIAPVVVIVSLR